jgi:hypothetical protein
MDWTSRIGGGEDMASGYPPNNDRTVPGTRFARGRKWLALGVLAVVAWSVLLPHSVLASALQLFVLLSLLWTGFFLATLDREVGIHPMRDGSRPLSSYIWQATMWVLVFLGPLVAVAALLWLVLRDT